MGRFLGSIFSFAQIFKKVYEVICGPSLTGGVVGRGGDTPKGSYPIATRMRILSRKMASTDFGRH
jgi:hypothetical protein